MRFTPRWAEKRSRTLLGNWSDPSRGRDWRLAAHHCSVQEYELPQLFMNLPYYVVSGVFPVMFHVLIIWLRLNGPPARRGEGLVSWRQSLPRIFLFPFGSLPPLAARR